MAATERLTKRLPTYPKIVSLKHYIYIEGVWYRGGGISGLSARVGSVCLGSVCLESVPSKMATAVESYWNAYLFEIVYKSLY